MNKTGKGILSAAFNWIKKNNNYKTSPKWTTNFVFVFINFGHLTLSCVHRLTDHFYRNVVNVGAYFAIETNFDVPVMSCRGAFKTRNEMGHPYSSRPFANYIFGYKRISLLKVRWLMCAACRLTLLLNFYYPLAQRELCARTVKCNVKR